MDMKKISFAVLIAAASMSAVLAETEAPVGAPGPAPASGASSVGASLLGASLMSFVAFYLQ
ncbi:hypothetical protein ACHQM5_012368 [Ranunculus cassubicifolius]